MSQLTDHQQQVVHHVDGHARVVAVAGAGKTTTLTHFIAARLQAGVAPRRMLVLMYNKAAQQEFQQRLSGCLPGQVVPEVRTFHSLGLRIYHKLIALGQLPAFERRLLADGEVEGQVWRLLQQLADDDTRQDILSQRKKWVEPAVGFIELVKSGLESPQEVYEQLDLPVQCRMFVKLFALFEDWRKQQRRIGFSDMLYDPVMHLRHDAEAARYFGGHMQWILVDEYQDINGIQQHLLELLHGGRGSVMVIGDPDQTIYEFRGSRPEFIVSGFANQLGGVTTYQLPETFRYGHRLSLLANHLIHHNRQRDPVMGLSHPSTPATQVQVHTCSANAEAQQVLALVKQCMATVPAHQIAVIHRLWALCAPVELALLQAGIPYQLDHSLSVLERWELEIFWLLLEIAAGRFGERSRDQRRHAWLQILTTPFPKVRRAVLEEMADTLADHSENLGVALQQAIPANLSRWQKAQLQARAEVLDSAERVVVPVERLLNAYIDTTELEKGIEDSAFSAQQVEDRLQTIRAFVRFMADTNVSSDQALDLLLQLRDRARAQSRERHGGVRLTSIHKSKGLEWPVVIIPGLNGHYFPYSPEGEFSTPASDESERRLLYVAMTRAIQQLHLLVPTPQVRRKPDDNSHARERPSPFFRELNIACSDRVATALEQSQPRLTLEGEIAEWLPAYLQAQPQPPELVIQPVRVAVVKHRADAQQPSRPKQLSASPSPQRLVHARLGAGVVVEMDEQYLIVHFENERTTRRLDRALAEPHIQWLH